jgi:CubicO group peptidase (beta-lactamase class C family)
MKNIYLIVMLMSIILSCTESDDTPDNITPETELYFPPTNGSNWETTDLNSLNWNQNELENLYNHLSTNNTRAFIVLKDGKIIIEKYWGNNILNTAAFDAQTNWYWASAGKTITATLVGIAQEEGFLNINDKTSDYLGNAWTSLSLEKENLIRIQNQLNMTTGLDFEVPSLDCTEPDCLQYRSDAGNQWFYHNAPYTLLEQVVSNATGLDYNTYTNQKIESVIGMNGQWIPLGNNNVYWSTPRDMARFGLLMLNQGIWEDIPVLADENYFQQMVNSSQEINPSYGYLWWLNGKSSIVFPGLETSFSSNLSSEAPDDLFAGMGKNGQFIDIVPSRNLVVIRMGEAPDEALVPIQFHNEMWQKLNAVINE